MIILLALKEIWHSLFGFQHPRSALIRKNISWSLVFQAVGVLISFLMLPITLAYLPAEKYGILLTLNALVGWFTLFDLGLGLGLQNNLTQALSKKNFALAQSYVSTAYASLTAIFGFLLILFYTFKEYINWSLVLGTPPSLSGEIASLANVVVFAFSAQFVLRLISNIATANQKNALGRLANMISGLVSLVSIVIISQTTKDNLLLYGSVISIIPVVVYAVMSIVLFSGIYKTIAPKITAIHWPLLAKMLRLGIKFFTVQLSLVLIHYGDYLIISHIFGSQAVVSYNVAYKYFALLTTSFALVLAPFWPATTDAYARKEID
jgi:O-antigen/teichoic acid export membrane protein